MHIKLISLIFACVIVVALANVTPRPFIRSRYSVRWRCNNETVASTAGNVMELSTTAAPPAPVPVSESNVAKKIEVVALAMGASTSTQHPRSKEASSTVSADYDYYGNELENAIHK